MSQSETINELAAALSKAQGEMQAAIKDKINPFFKSSYADLGSVWDAARPVLSKHGLSIMQTTEVGADGVKILMVTTLLHSSGQWAKSFLPLLPAKNDNQGIGASLTYLRRYALSAIVGVVCDDDDDGETSIGRGKSQTNQPATPNKPQATEEPTEPVERVGKAEIIALTTLIKNLDEQSHKDFLDWIKKEYKAESLQDIPKNRFEKCVVSINNKIKYLNDIKKVNMAVA